MAILSTSTELIADVRGLINEATASFWTDAFILRQLKKGHQIVSTKLNLVPTIWTATLTDSSPSSGEAQITDDREVRMPSSYISIDDGGFYYNDDVITPVNMKTLTEWYGTSWLDDAGQVVHYYRRGDMIGFYRQCSAGDTIRAYGIKMPTEISETQAPFDGDYRTVGYRSLLVDYAVAMCWKKKNEMAKFAFYLTPKTGSFWVGLDEMKDELSESEGMMIPEWRGDGSTGGGVNRASIF